jgi:hypothetical protein
MNDNSDTDSDQHSERDAQTFDRYYETGDD